MQWSPEDIKVIIPIGGEATRMRPLTVETSKATVRLLNRPLLEFPILELAKQGVKEFIFGVKGYVNYKSLFDTFKEGIGFSARYRIKPRVHFKYQPRVDSVGNADSVRINMDYYRIDDITLVIQGDNLIKLDLKKLVDYHLSKGAIMTIVLKKWHDVREFGVADLGEDMKIRKFVEKPKEGEAPSNLINTGVYVLSPKIRDIFASDEVSAMREEGKMDFGKDIIPCLIQKGYPVYGYVTDSLWFDVGTPERYLEAMRVLLESLDEHEMGGKRIDQSKRIFVQGTSPDSIRRRNVIAMKYRKGRMKIEGSVLIGRHCQIGNNVYLENSTIDNFSILRNNVRVVRSSIMDRAFIGEGVVIENSVIARHVEIRGGARIIGSVIGDDVVIDADTEIVNSKIYPHKVINANSKIHDTVLT
ncbi:Nucleotidyl transferase [Metallosphaera sedula]|uniref:Nucleotidyl transferase n=3 Tax=Metallosphaera TaxID=41980 RepID=A4YGM5_METS5|nr:MULTISPECIES: NDP-sugar synthase [Metallosphaera]ABP95577.1 Nucleotidyl transferase [Metallosphaera sedula DSM 5348]AIM27561.1 Nucleotidyl transferase [Metallosphaera sedula]AKV74422.1 nucleotidyltransferase [Metallosphaera sedula]AKV76661.1 nucleotidyltransferase [Metallosphaera sedula]AKV78913.1 nucleotidyltransferase [Metallosphaera sedula]